MNDTEARFTQLLGRLQYLHESLQTGRDAAGDRMTLAMVRERIGRYIADAERDGRKPKGEE